MLGLLKRNKEAIDRVKIVVEILAYVSALLFFLFKVYGGGYLTANLALSIKCERQKSPRPLTDDKDYLSVTTIVKRGGNRSVKLLCGAVRVEILSTGKAEQAGLQVMRIDTYDIRGQLKQGDASAVDFLKFHSKARFRFLYMPPGDESQFACMFRVPPEEACRIDVAILGISSLLKLKISQWRASAIALPEPQKKDS